VGPFAESCAVPLAALHQAAGTPDGAAAALVALLQPVAAALAALPALAVSSSDAGRLARGQAVLLRGRDAPRTEGLVAVSTRGALVALAEVERGELVPRRVFNLPH
jgi:tRNA pseudouridine55 synthase